MVLEDFHRLVGETIMNCQCIEHDIKFIYSGMLKGNFDDNYNEVSDQTLGSVLKKLEKLDNCDGNPHLSVKDYDLLDEIRDIRNYWVHQAYTDFVYLSGADYDNELGRSYRRLQNDHNRLSKLSSNVERVRLDVLKKFGRI